MKLRAVLMLYVIYVVSAQQQRQDVIQDIFGNQNENAQGPQIIGGFFNRGSFGVIVQPEPADTVSFIFE